MKKCATNYGRCFKVEAEGVAADLAGAVAEAAQEEAGLAEMKEHRKVRLNLGTISQLFL